MIYGTIIHRIFRGHWFTPEFDHYDKYGEYYRGCEYCKVKDPVTYRRDRHNEGICPKALMGYWRECKGRTINGIAYGECGND